MTSVLDLDVHLRYQVDTLVVSVIKSFDFERLGTVRACMRVRLHVFNQAAAQQRSRSIFKQSVSSKFDVRTT